MSPRSKLLIQVDERRDSYLQASEVIDWNSTGILELAASFSRENSNEVALAREAFEWARDSVRHSYDHDLSLSPARASAVLEVRQGLCYSKSHLLVALLRANSIPAGFCYQRLAVDPGAGIFCLHGLVAVFLKDFGWYRADPRGLGGGAEKEARFTPPVECLAFEPVGEGEKDYPHVWSEPAPDVVSALQSSDS